MGGLINSIANLGGGSNQYQAKAPKIGFQAQKANLAGTNYGGAITGALAGSGAARAGQAGLVGTLQDQANGAGPSVAQSQLATATAANVNNAAGMAASARGVNPALAARMAADSAAGANQAAAGQGATLRAQEILAARQQLGDVLNQQRGADISTLGTAGGLQQGQNALELQNTLGTEGINAGVATANASNELAADQINAGVAGQNAQIGSQMFGGLLQGGGAALAALAHGGEVPGDGPKKSDQDLAREVHAKRHPKKAPKADKAAGKLSDKELAAQVTLQRYFKAAPKHAGGGAIAGAFMQGVGRGMNGLPPAAAPTIASYAPPSSVPPMLARPAEGGAPAADWSPSPLTTPAAPEAPGPASTIGKMLQGLGQGMQRKPYARGGDVRPVFMAEGTVPGRAPVPDRDTTKNDVVPAWLTPGEHVTRRTIAKMPGMKETLDAINDSPDVAQATRSFVAHLMKSRGPSGYRRVAEAKRKASGA